VRLPYYKNRRGQIYHGDCLDIMKEMADDSAEALVTDPPYCSGGRQQQGARNQIEKSVRDEWFMGDNMGVDSYVWWMREIAQEAIRIVTPGSMAFVFTDWRQYTTLVNTWESARWTLRGAFVWDKAKGGAMGSYWRNNHEWAAIFTKGKPRPLAHRSCFNTWQGPKPQGGLHPTQKPLELMEYILGAVTPKPARILDPFIGSGTTLLAACSTGHNFIGIEIDEAYVKKSIRRVESYKSGLTEAEQEEGQQTLFEE